MKSLINLILLTVLITGSYLAGMRHYEQQEKEIILEIDNEFLIAARNYYQLELDQIFYLGCTLCYRRGEHTYPVATHSFLKFYYEDYQKRGNYEDRK